MASVELRTGSALGANSTKRTLSGDWTEWSVVGGPPEAKCDVTVEPAAEKKRWNPRPWSQTQDLVACDTLLGNEEPRWEPREIRTVEPSNLSDPSNSSCLPPADPQAVNEVVRRQALLKSGQAPEWLFVCGAQNGLITWRHENKPLMLLFTTPLVAKDYIPATKVAAEVRQFKVDSLPATAQNWLAGGAERFALNRCPRCTVFNTYATQDLIHGKFMEFWSLSGPFSGFAVRSEFENTCGILPPIARGPVRRWS
jgi:hypothetical protein